MYIAKAAAKSKYGWDLGWPELRAVWQCWRKSAADPILAMPAP